MHLVDRFSAHLAHLLNTPTNGEVWIEPGEIYVDLLELLATKYAGPLLFHPRYDWRMDAHEAASRYFDATLARKFLLSGRAQFSSAHKVFLSLVQRLPDPGWKSANLIRSHEPPCTDTKTLISNKAATALKSRISTLSSDISDGNAASVIRKRDGALWIHSGHVAIEIPEELSLWDAIVTTPPKIDFLATPESFNHFCGLLIDAMRTANRPFQEVLGLGHGLCPFDWIEDLTTNQVRSLRKYLSVLSPNQSLGDWSIDYARAQWQRNRVSGFAEFDEFWNSEIAHALKGPRQHAYLGPIEALSLEPSNDSDLSDSLMNSQEWADILTEKVKSGELSETEAEMLNLLFNGSSFADLEIEPRFAAILKNQDGLAEWGTSISSRRNCF